MYCIFCKNNSSGSVSVEHIIPESLGNSKHILPRGVVCDKCNNYFARKVEKPILDSEYFTHSRFTNYLPNKRGRIPPLENVFGPEGIGLGLSRDTSGMTHMYPMDDKDGERFIKYVLTHKRGHFIIPQPKPVDTYLVSRLLAKMALEVLTHKVMEFEGWEKEVIFRQELDEVRHFARYGDVKKKWPYYERRVYEENRKFTSESGEDHQVLHEFDTLYTKDQELYAVIAILGVEYTINLVGPEMEGYIKWLHENDYRSPLYPNGGI
jgi:hypothetical protein